MTYRPTEGDVLASLDVLTDIQNLSDSLAPEDAVAYRELCEQVMASAKLTIDLLNQQIVKTLEGDLVRNGRRYYVGRKTEKERYDHQRIQGHIIRHVLDYTEVDEETGEVTPLGRGDAVRLGVHLMGEMYLSEGTKAKKGQIDRLQIPRNKVIDIQRGEKEAKWVPA